MVDRLAGEGVRTYQPDGLWEAVGYTGSDTKNYVRHEGEALYRRSLYMFVKRTSGHPLMSLFDAPTRETSCVARSRTDTPLQALALLNETLYVESARATAQRILTAATTDEERLRYAIVLMTGTEPDQQDVAEGLAFLDQARAGYGDDEAEALSLLQVGDSPRDESLAVIDHAAWTLWCSVVLASDRCLTLY